MSHWYFLSFLADLFLDLRTLYFGHYSANFIYQVDGMVEEFADINRIMEKSGTFMMDRKKLLQLVGKANSNLADVILKVGLFER